jgi:hypothetical protein
MDVTRAGSGVKSGRIDGAQLPHAAKLMAALSTGPRSVVKLREDTGLDSDQILAALTALAETNMVVLEDSNGSVQARLSEDAQSALKSA